MIARAILSILCVICAVSTCPAGIVCYGDQQGQHVSFIEIREISLNTLPLFGPPSISGDTLLFNGPGFISQAIDNDIDFLAGRLEMTIEANDGFLIDHINVKEFGSFLGFGHDAVALAQALGFVVANGQVYQDSLFFQNSGSGQGVWDEDFTISFPPTDSLTFTLDSQLLTAAGPLEASFIDKVGIHITVGSFAVIPEPGALRAVMLLVIAVVATRRPRWQRRRPTQQ